MGVKKRDIQRRWWRISIGGVVLLGIILLFNNRSVIGLEGESCREWASITELIPPVAAYEFDSSEWNPIDEVNYEFLKQLPDVCKDHLLDIFNKIWVSG